ncbi:MAG: choice-of-anchor D domain-containing protein [Pseudomonadota bacterium]
MRPTLLLSLFGVFSLACTEYALGDGNNGPGDIDDGGDPNITVDPPVVDFGNVEVADLTEHIEVVTVGNDGTGDLHIQNLELEDTSAPFSITGVQSVLVQPGGSTQFEVVYDPTTAMVDDTFILIDSDDPDTPVTRVQVIGQGIAPVIEISPTSYDFGTIWVGCENELALTVSNIGNADLVVDGYTFNSANTDLLFSGIDDENGGDDGLITLGPSESEEVFVSYLPLDEYADVAYLVVSSNDPFNPTVQVSQQGNGAFYGQALDVFEQPIRGASDIIFAMDKSGSMNDNMANVIANFGTFVTTMVNQDSDFHVAATVNDDGCIVGSNLWIDNTFTESEAEDTINTMINIGGSYASATERAFTLLEACLVQTGRGNCNEGLIREDGKLNLVGVSDEPEQSANPWSYYVTLFQSYKDDPDDVVMHAVGGDYPSGCGSAAAYTGFYEATVATGGIFLSICATDWSAHLTALAEASAETLDTFQLTADPVPETIQVRVDGVTSTLGWEYDRGQNAIIFETDYIPEGGSTIEVEYALMGDCEG